MEAYRIEHQKYLHSILEGIPGQLYDFRWNTKGHPIIYTAESRSLALVEKSANMSRPLQGLPSHFIMAIIELPDDPFHKVFPEDLPKGWNSVSKYHPRTQELGDGFTRSDQLALFVPSSIVKGEFNVLVNPRIATEMDLPVRIEPIDSRLTNHPA